MKKWYENEYVWYHSAWERTEAFVDLGEGRFEFQGEEIDAGGFVYSELMDGYYYDDGYDGVCEAKCENGIYYAPSDWLCDDGFIWSEHENRYLEECIAFEDDHGEYATEKWYRENGYVEAVCDRWGETVWSDDFILTEDTDTYYTYDYANDNFYWDDEGEVFYEEEPNMRIYDYHSWDGDYEERSLGNEKLSRTGRKLFMGTELEVDELSIDREDFAEGMLERLGDDLFHAERDGSVDHEYISQPMTLEMRKSLEENEREALRYASYNARSHDAGSCGLHVHVNESFFDDHSYLRLKTILEFFKEELYRFSRRQSFSGSYYSFERSGDGQSDKNNLKLKALKDECVHGHSGWYNEHSGNTFEFRLFRGTLKYSTLMASLEIVSNICWIADSDIEDITWNMLVEDGDYCKEYAESRGISNEEDTLHLGLLEKKYREELEEERRREELRRLRMSLCADVNNALRGYIMQKDGINYYFNKHGSGLIMFRIADNGFTGEAIRRLDDDESFDILERTYNQWDYVMDREEYIAKVFDKLEINKLEING